jgi:IS5 family transposase
LELATGSTAGTIGAVTARRRARGRGAQTKLKAAKTLEELADRCEKVCSQIRQRVAGEPIKDRLISLWDPNARPIRKGKLGKPTEFGYVDQLCEITANTKRGARGFILPPKSQIGNAAENALLPETAEALKNLDVTLTEIVLDGGFMPTPSNAALDGLADTIHITGRQETGSQRTRRRRQRYRTGAEGRISHLKRGYGVDRSRLKGDTGHQIWAGWAALSYNAETYTTLR